MALDVSFAYCCSVSLGDSRTLRLVGYPKSVRTTPCRRSVSFSLPSGRFVCFCATRRSGRRSLYCCFYLRICSTAFFHRRSLAKCRDDSRSSGVGTSKFFPLCEETEERKQAARVSCSLPNLSGTKGAPAPGLFPTSDRARGCRHHGCHHHGCRRRRSRLRGAWLHSP